ncbi:MAG: helix-turn-helix transcriptional regulator [Moraxella sp.]|nr:helix-turn-helix transcriptional regulator [Moraxella sp.]
MGIAVGLDEFVASTCINRYEKGIHQPDLLILLRLAEMLEMPPAYFFADDDLAQLILQYQTRRQ